MEKVKVVKVNEYEKVVDSRWGNRDCDDIYYKVTVKIKNMIKEIKLSYTTDYNTKLWGTKVCDTEWTKELAALDIEVDFSDIVKEFDVIGAEIKAKQDVVKNTKATEAYNSAWVHAFIKEYTGKFAGLTLKVNCTLEQFLASDYRSNLTVQMFYKGYNESIYREGGEYKYRIDYKTRRCSKNVSLIFSNFIDYVDDKVDSAKLRKEIDNKKESLAQRFTADFGIIVKPASYNNDSQYSFELPSNDSYPDTIGFNYYKVDENHVVEKFSVPNTYLELNKTRYGEYVSIMMEQIAEKVANAKDDKKYRLNALVSSLTKERFTKVVKLIIAQKIDKNAEDKATTERWNAERAAARAKEQDTTVAA